MTNKLWCWHGGEDHLMPFSQQVHVGHVTHGCTVKVSPNSDCIHVVNVGGIDQKILLFT